VAFAGCGEAWVRRTAIRSSIHLGKAMFEMMLMTPERLRKFVTVAGDGVERLRQAIGQGRGIVYVTAHIGNWEIMGGKIASLHPVSVVAAPIEPEPVNEMIVGLRARLKVRTIVRDRPGASRELIRVFRENRILGILIDQDTDVDGAFVDFFGSPAWTPTAAAQMTLKFNAPVMFGYVHRVNDTRHEVHIEGPLELVRTGDEKRDVLDNTALFTKMIENAIRKRPEQWVWMHRRWRRQP
jgi:KDO2-lipid IV(A) lauroyltransferase